VVVAVYIAAPFTARARVNMAPEESPREKLLTERTAVLTAIRDLDFDFQTGKLLEADYRALRDKYAARGVEILKELDTLPESDRRPHAESAGRRLKVAAADEIEAAVQARRRVKSPSSRLVQEDVVEAAVRARRQSNTGGQLSAVGGLVCPSCGKPIDATDKFCARCGAALNREAAH
jgi:hypothetical protein